MSLRSVDLSPASWMSVAWLDPLSLSLSLKSNKLKGLMLNLFLEVSDEVYSSLGQSVVSINVA